MKFAYPSALRLKQGREYDLLFRTGSRFRGRLVRLLCIRRPEEGTRFGLAVGKKMAMAAGRNRGRRILKEALRRLHPWLVPGWWIVLSLSEVGLTSSSQEIYLELAELFQKRGMFNDEWPGPQWS